MYDWNNDYEEKEIFAIKTFDELKTNYDGFISFLDITKILFILLRKKEVDVFFFVRLQIKIMKNNKHKIIEQ